MRVYHYVNAQYGLQNLRMRRLKVARLHALNDPFELDAFTVDDPEERRALVTLKNTLDRINGLLCFSERTDNPVQWSHYADRHRGLCLGFDVPDMVLAKVNYLPRRIKVKLKSLLGSPEAEAVVKNYLATKFKHWEYEKERRRWVRLENCKQDGDHHFYPFDDDLVLKEVFVGLDSHISRTELTCTLGSLAQTVDTHKMRPALKSFRVLRQRQKSAWQ